ncbi:MAG: hypothetical protein Q7U86_07015 [Draconibacterium sp.]|nr:hypothetical protein [Draconibacterium sp.]
MKAKQRAIFPFSLPETDRPDIQLERIDLVSCPLKEIMCNVHLSSVNKSFLESKQYYKTKDFQKSIESLKSAFYKTTELMKHPCTKCAQHFRSNIIETLEIIYGELGKITKGIFGNKRYLSSYNTAVNLLKEFEAAAPYNLFHQSESKDRFLGNHLN